MRSIYSAVPALLFAALAVAQGAGRSDPGDPKAKVPPVEFRSAFGDYRPDAETELRDWRKSNEEVGAAHAGHRPDPGPGSETSKPKPGKPEDSGRHGGHK